MKNGARLEVQYVMLFGAAVNRFVFDTMLWTIHTGKDKKGRGRHGKEKDHYH